MIVQRAFSVILTLQAFLYGWALWVFLFAKDSHVPVAFIVIHVVAALNGLLAVLGCMTYFLARTHPPRALWSALAALPSLGVVAYLSLLKTLHLGR